MCKAESLLFDNNIACASSNFSVPDIPPVHSPHSAATAAHSLDVISSEPGIFFGGGSTNSVEDREYGDLGAVAP
jgi:hypothetical protein